MDPFNQETRTRIENAVLAFLEAHGKTERKQLFAPAFDALRVTPEDLRDNVPSGKYSKAKSYVGMIVSELVTVGRIVYDEANLLAVKPAKPVKAVKPAAVEPVAAPVKPAKAEKPKKVPAVLKPTPAQERKALIASVIDSYLSPAEAQEKGAESLAGLLKSVIGDVLKKHPELASVPPAAAVESVRTEIEKVKVVRERLLARAAEAAPVAKAAVIAEKPHVKQPDQPVAKPVAKAVVKAVEKPVPAVPAGPVFPIPTIDKLIRESFAKHDLCVAGKLTRELYEKHLVSTLTHVFGEAEEFFENFAFMLIKKLYGAAVKRENYAPGPEDEGIDGEFFIEDAVGFSEHVMMQAKTRKNNKASISMKVLREYVGVMLLHAADKCIIISNSLISKDAREAAKKLKNVIMIGDRELYELMKKTQFGIRTEKGLEKIDLEALIDLIDGR